MTSMQTSNTKICVEQPVIPNDNLMFGYTIKWILEGTEFKITCPGFSGILYKDIYKFDSYFESRLKELCWTPRALYTLMKLILSLKPTSHFTINCVTGKVRDERLIQYGRSWFL